jgi:hypothetical protein
MMKRILVAVLSVWLVAGCQSESEDPQVDCSTSSLNLSVSNITDASCNASDGSLTVSGSGGSGEYTYRLNTGQLNSSGTFNNLAAAVYTVTVDDGDCTVETSATVSNVEGVTIASVTSEDAGCGSQEGNIVITADEGTPPYRYALDDGAFQDANSFTALGQGTYTVTVSDSEDCEITQEVSVLSGVSWESDIEPIITTNCALENCHGGSQSPDFREFSNVADNAERIKARTGNGSMPPTGALPDEQVEAIACWVDDGAPNN